MLPFSKKIFTPPRFEAYVIDEGEDFEVQMFQDGCQIGSALFPDDGTGAAFVLAKQLADNWIAQVAH